MDTDFQFHSQGKYVELQKDVSSISSPCRPCVSGQMLLFSQQHIIKKYYDKFNFYFAKPVNEILANCKESHVILFHDFQYYDQSIEYIGQLYKQYFDELLTQEMMQEQSYNYYRIQIRQAETIEKRYRKLQKLKRKQSISVKNVEGIHKEILNSLESGVTNRSFDSSIHDIYDKSYHKPTRFVVFLTISQVIDLKYQPSLNIKLWESDDNDDFHDFLDQIRQCQKSRLNSQGSDQIVQDITPFLKKIKQTHPKLPTLQLKELMNEDYQKRKRKPVLNLNLNQIQTPNLMQMMQQFSKNSLKIEAQTERGGHNLQEESRRQKDFGVVQAKSVSPINKLKDKYQAQQMYSVMNPDRSLMKRQIRNKLMINRPNQSEKTIDITSRKKPEQESEKLLKMLQLQNVSLPVSPRRLEIKFSLNKLILEQQTTMKTQLKDSIIENSYGFLTCRNSKQDIGAFRSIGSMNLSKKHPKLTLLISPKSKK